MFNQVIVSIRRQLSAHLFTTCIFCILILVVLIGGLIQVISSLAFSAYLENNTQQPPIQISSTTSPLSLLFDSSPEQILADASIRTNKNTTSENANVRKPQQNDIPHISMASQKTDRGDKLSGNRGFSNTKILYKPYMMNNNGQHQFQMAKSDLNKTPTPIGSKSKTINSTVYKSVTPSITDRVIADLKKEELLAQQRAKVESDIGAIESDEAIYIDGDEDDLTIRNRNYTDIEISAEKLATDQMIEIRDNMRAEINEKPKPIIINGAAKKILPQSIGARDKKSSKKPTTVNQKFKNFGFVDISDTDSSETVNIDDDEDDYDDYANSGSGDFNSNMLIEQAAAVAAAAEISNQDWIAPTIEKFKAKKLNKQERIIKSFVDNSYGISGSSKEVDNIDTIDFIDKDDNDEDDDQMISRKIAKAYNKKQNVSQGSTKNVSQKLKSKPKPQLKSKSKKNNRQKANANNKRKSKEHHYIEEYFSGLKTNSNGESVGVSGGAEVEFYKMEPQVRRTLGNIKKSEEKSQQILLCKGEGELCSMLFKTPIKPVAAP